MPDIFSLKNNIIVVSPNEHINPKRYIKVFLGFLSPVIVGDFVSIKLKSLFLESTSLYFLFIKLNISKIFCLFFPYIFKEG